MKIRYAALALFLFLAAGATVSAAPGDLPECVRHAAFAGITATDAVGNLLGPEDPSDWGCVGGGLRDVTPPTVTTLCFEPAYPNPTTGATVLGFTLPRAANVSVVVYGQHGKHGRAFPVRTLASRDFAPGVYSITWDLKDDQGVRLAPDIYRAVLVAEGHELCGDIEVR